ncbi:hypothetical protein GCM10007989_05160 [Devosia pacifica]|uniref:Uncharacterized protein n=1 Tax=Devosia pacifica TaxID=1335967 RepID=A0A918VMP2_9HYPH|nr:hypothetical protein [Devosia pacifica]GHA13529.1 hypothetical protein GCM10007989_05160 [Devosia pacifica]
MRTALNQISRSDAQILTDQIRVAVDQLWELLLEAHERQAWKAMGYPTWDAYIAGEFNMSRRHSYRLLDQGMVNRAIADASGQDVTHGSQISEREARDLKPIIGEVTSEIRSRVESGEHPGRAASEVVEAKRANKKRADAEKSVRKVEREAEQAKHDKERARNADALPDAVKEQQARKAEAMGERRQQRTEVGIDRIAALEAENEELRETNNALETEIATLRSGHAKWEGMRVQFEKGGFEKVVADKDEEIRVLKTRVESESRDKVGWKRSADHWKAEAERLGYSRDLIMDLETGEITDA